jgi:general secretion pathway protein N
MNAADQRRLTPWLAALGVLLAALWAVFLAGIGRGVRWKTPGTPHALPTAHQAGIAAPPPLKDYAAIWQRPLFTTTRRPAPETGDHQSSRVSLDNLELTGVIMAPGLHIALLRDRRDGHGVRVREGAHLADGDWVLDTLQPRSAVFVDDGRRTRLTLKAATGNAVAQTGSSATAAQAEPAASQHASQPPSSAANAAQRARVKAIKQRIEQRRQQQAAHAGDH